jgi:hypothetical protein
MEEIKDSEQDVERAVKEAQERLSRALEQKAQIQKAALDKALAVQEALRVKEELELATQRAAIRANEEKWVKIRADKEAAEVAEQAARRAESIRIQAEVILQESLDRQRKADAARVKKAQDDAFRQEQENAQLLAELERPVLVEAVPNASENTGLEAPASGLEGTWGSPAIRRILQRDNSPDYNATQEPAPCQFAPQPDPLSTPPEIRTPGRLNFVDPNELDQFLKIAKADLGFPLNYNRVAALAAEFMVSGVAEAYDKMTKTRGCSHVSFLGALEYTLRNPEPELPVEPVQTIVPGSETVDTVIEPMTEDEALFSTQPEELVDVTSPQEI